MGLTRRHLLGAGAAALLGPRAAWSADAPLDVAYVNAAIWTGLPGAPRADAVGLVGSRIAAVGAAAVKRATGKSTRVVDLGGAFMTPGVIDCHTHFTRASFMISQASLRSAATPAEFTRRVGDAARALAPGEWLEGGNWDNDLWGGELPSRAWIDPVTPNTPVAVIRYDLHMLVLNSVALKLAGIDRNTPDVPGGVIERDARGEPTGIIKDAAKALVLRAIPARTEAQVEAAIRKGIALGLSKGVTQVHCPELDWDTLNAVRRMRGKGETDLRFYVFTPLRDWDKTAALVKEEGFGDDWVRWGAAKAQYDGSLGSRTALFYEPYLDDPSTRGIQVTKLEDLRAWVRGADAAGLNVAVHAIGDEANDEALDVMAEVARLNPPRDRRFRIEHAQHLSPQALGRFAKQGVIASVQPYHAIDDGRWAIKRIGAERLTRTYAFHTLLAGGARVCLGSDWPVAPLDPLTGLDAAVLRETLDGRNPQGWYPEQRISLEQALAGYTRDAAYAGFAENRMGTIAAGYLADLVVWDRDLFAVDPHRIKESKVLKTVVDGRERYGSGA